MCATALLLISKIYEISGYFLKYVTKKSFDWFVKISNSRELYTLKNNISRNSIHKTFIIVKKYWKVAKKSFIQCNIVEIEFFNEYPLNDFSYLVK